MWRMVWADVAVFVGKKEGVVDDEVVLQHRSGRDGFPMFFQPPLYHFSKQHSPAFEERLSIPRAGLLLHFTA